MGHANGREERKELFLGLLYGRPFCQRKPGNPTFELGVRNVPTVPADVPPRPPPLPLWYCSPLTSPWMEGHSYGSCGPVGEHTPLPSTHLLSRKQLLHILSKVKT